MKKSVIFLCGISFVILLLTALFISASVESEFYDLVNAERTMLGIHSLAYNEQLYTAAYLHSKDMAEQKYFSHTSKDGRSFSTRIKNQEYSYFSIGENIAYHSGEPNSLKVFSMWMESAGHKKNMLSLNFNDVGLGVFYDGSKTYYTLDLGKQLVSLTSTPVTPPTLAPVPTPTSTPNPSADDETEENKVHDDLPVISLFKMSISRTRITFLFKIDDEDFDKITYVDHATINTVEKNLCSRLQKSYCSTKKTFSNGNHDLEVFVYDKAGNVVSKKVEFSVR